MPSDPTTPTVADARTASLPASATVAPAVLPVSERYLLAEPIAEGGMGAVLRARDTILDRIVAVKVVRTQLLDRAGVVARFAVEARITGRLQHPGVPPVYDLGTLPDGRPFLAMKLIQGDTFAVLLRARASPAEELARHLLTFEAICQTVAYAHGQGVIHRDLKPLNVMVGAFGEVQVMDWGLAKESSQHPECAESSLPPARPDETRAGSILGTPAYMPPEQARGEAVDARADVFALGALLCEILTGLPPYRSLAEAQQADQGAALARLAACGADADLLALARACLAREPEERPADAAAVAHAIIAYRQGVDDRLRRAERERAEAAIRTAEERKRRRVQRLLALAALLLVAGAVAAWWWLDRQVAERQQAIAANLARARAALGKQRLTEVGAALDQARLRLGEARHEEEQRLRREYTLCRTLDEIFAARWVMVGGSFPTDELRRRYPETLREQGLDLTVPTAELVATLDGFLVRERLLLALEDWLSLVATRPERHPLVALLNATDDDPLRRRARTAWGAGDSGTLAEIAAQTKPEQLTPRLVFLLVGRKALPTPERLRLLRWGRQRFPQDVGITYRLFVELLPENAPQSPSALLEGEGAMRAILLDQPDNVAAWMNLSNVLRVRGDLPAALDAADQALARNDATPLGWLVRANALADDRQFAAAVTAYRRALALRPEDPSIHRNLGTTLEDSGDPAGALAAFDAALKINPDFAPAHVAKAFLFLRRPDLAAALTAAQRAVQCDATLSAAHNIVGLVHMAQKQPAAAVRPFRQAIALAPAEPEYPYNLANALRETGDNRGAVSMYQQALRLAPTFAEAHANVGVLLHVRGDVDGAQTAFTRAIESNPRQRAGYVNLGVLLRERGDLAGAVATLRRGLQHLPGDPHLLLGLAEYLQGQGKFTEAVTAYEQGYDRARNEPGLRPVYETGLRVARGLVFADANLPRILEGADPLPPGQAVFAAQFCTVRANRHREAVDLYRAAFRAEASFTTSPGPHRLQAARAALLAAVGAGVHPPPVRERAAYRGEALAWLRGEFAARRIEVKQSLAPWLTDPGLRSVRDPEALAGLPDEERRAWEQFWAELRRALKE